MSDDEVRAIYDEHAKQTVLGLGFWREELFRREVLRESRRTTTLNLYMLRLTIANAVVAVVAAVAAIAALFG